MSETARHIHDIQKQTNVDSVALVGARSRRDVVLAAGRAFAGIAGSYVSGSVAAGVVTDKVEDADCGVIADRRCFPRLGPDGKNETPVEVVADLQEHLGPLVRETYAGAIVSPMKRGLRVFIHEPFPDGQDPYVDVVFAMQRNGKPGLWIPNMDGERWDPAHPQRHVELLNSGDQALRSFRAQVIRLGKVWNKQWSEPALNSFNISALGLEAITETAPIELGLLAFFDHAATSLATRHTEDPAGVSGPISLKKPRDVTVKRLVDARDALAEALEHDDDPDAVQAAMHRIYFAYVPEPADIGTKDQLANRLRISTPRLRASATGIAPVGTISNKRSYGGGRG